MFFVREVKKKLPILLHSSISIYSNGIFFCVLNHILQFSAPRIESGHFAHHFRIPVSKKWLAPQKSKAPGSRPCVFANTPAFNLPKHHKSVHVARISPALGITKTPNSRSYIRTQIPPDVCTKKKTTTTKTMMMCCRCTRGAGRCNTRSQYNRGRGPMYT
jgi:hypothetical protein